MKWCANNKAYQTNSRKSVALTILRDILVQIENTVESKLSVNLSRMVSEDASPMKREHIYQELGTSQVAEVHQCKMNRVREITSLALPTHSKIDT